MKPDVTAVLPSLDASSRPSEKLYPSVPNLFLADRQHNRAVSGNGPCISSTLKLNHHCL